MKYPSQAFEDLGGIDLYDNGDIKAYIQEVMVFIELVDIDELRGESVPSNEATSKLKSLSSSLNYAFLDAQQSKLVIISSRLD